MRLQSVIIVSALSIIACKDPHTKDVIDKCTPLEMVELCETEEGETGGDETGGGESGGPTALGPDECRHNVTQEFVGYRMQCVGELFTTLDFNLPLGFNCESALGAKFCSQHHVFGPPNDTYEAPDVMACCGEAWDSQYDDDYLEFCNYDLIQQVCISLAKRLESHILDGDFGSYDGQASALQSWIATNYSECFETLRQNDTNPDPAALESSWKIPNNPAWKVIDDMVIHIDAGTESIAVLRPESPDDWIACNGAHGNNDEIFEDVTTPNGGIVAGVELSSDVVGELVGPEIFGSTVTGSATFETSCLPHGCPTALFSYDVDGPLFTLEDLNLYTQSFTVTNEVSWLAVDRARIELWGQAPGKVISDPDGRPLGYTIPAGEAHFLLAGASDGNYNRFIAANATDIEISVLRGVWVVHSFVIQYEDGGGNVWTLDLAESRWQ
jgi:hypothetical protein